mmetsp:Transcript_1763/g.5298  ORF Transcript_1763/g.5298 Transcript_1763/m.5298 type:complete len:123 (+) Transcript_1763:194-562(+)
MACLAPLCECACLGTGTEDDEDASSPSSGSGHGAEKGFFANEEVSAPNSPNTTKAGGGGPAAADAPEDDGSFSEVQKAAAASEDGFSDVASNTSNEPFGVSIAKTTLGDSLQSLDLNSTDTK